MENGSQAQPNLKLPDASGGSFPSCPRVCAVRGSQTQTLPNKHGRREMASMHLKALQDTGCVSLTWDSPARTVGLASEHAACMSDSESHGFFLSLGHWPE